MWGEAGVAEEDMLDAEAAKQVLRRAARMLAPYRRKVVVATLLLFAWTGCVLAGPFLVRFAIDDGLTANDVGALNLAVGLYVAVALIGYVVYRRVVLLVSVVGESFLRDIRVRVFAHLMRLSMPFYDREKAGVVVSRMTSDVESLQELVQFGLLMFVTNTLLLVFSFIALAVVSW
ncbi:MAG TPA: ABC transporter transmembrane domain-containing protein, partial [Acidimicrobiales bacterium]